LPAAYGDGDRHTTSAACCSDPTQLSTFDASSKFNRCTSFSSRTLHVPTMNRCRPESPTTAARHRAWYFAVYTVDDVLNMMERPPYFVACRPRCCV